MAKGTLPVLDLSLQFRMAFILNLNLVYTSLEGSILIDALYCRSELFSRRYYGKVGTIHVFIVCDATLAMPRYEVD